MACNWVKNNKGEIVGALNPQGQKSQLFEELKNSFGLEKASEMYAVAYSDDFQDVVGVTTIIPKDNNILGSNNIKGKFLTEKERVDLQKEIESNYTNNSLEVFNKKKDDIRMRVFNYNEPLMSRILNGVDLRVAEGLIRDKKKTYLLYADGVIIGEFYSTDDIKKVISYIESNLIKEEPSQQQLLRFITAENGDIPLTNEHKVDLQNFMLSVGEKNPQKIIDLFIDENGLFNISAKKLKQSGYYSDYEILKITDDIELQDKIKTAVEALKNTSEDTNYIEYSNTLVKQGEINSFGKVNTLNPFELEQRAIQELGGLSEEDFYIALEDFPNKNLKWEDYKDYVVAEVMQERDGELVIKPKTDTLTLLEQTAKIPTDVDFIDSLYTSNITEEYEQSVLDNLGIDITGFKDKLFDASFIEALHAFAISPNKTNTERLAVEYDRVFEVDNSPKKEKIKANKELTGYVKITNTTKTEQELFTKNNLIKVNDNTYIKVTPKPLEELYQIVGTHFKEIKDLKKYIQDKAVKSEEIELYKMYFDNNLSKYNGIFSKSISSVSNKGKGTKEILTPNSTRKVVMMTPDYYLKLVREGINTGIINRLTELKADESVIEKYKRIINEGIDENINQGSKAVIQDAVSKGQKLDMPFIFFDTSGKRLEQDGRNRANYAREIGEKLIPVMVENLPIQNKEVKKGENFDKLDDFISDFHTEMVKERNKDSEKWKNYYSNFEINESGITLKSTDPLTLEKVSLYADENMKSYSLVSKQIPALKNIETDITQRDEYYNFPENLKETKVKELSKIDQENIILKNQEEQFIRIDQDVYELQEVLGNLSLYNKIGRNTDTHLKFGIEKTESKFKLRDYTHLNEQTENFTKEKKYLSKEEKDDLDCR